MYPSRRPQSSPPPKETRRGHPVGPDNAGGTSRTEGRRAQADSPRRPRRAVSGCPVQHRLRPRSHRDRAGRGRRRRRRHTVHAPDLRRDHGPAHRAGRLIPAGDRRAPRRRWRLRRSQERPRRRREPARRRQSRRRLRPDRGGQFGRRRSQPGERVPVTCSPSARPESYRSAAVDRLEPGRDRRIRKSTDGAHLAVHRGHLRHDHRRTAPTLPRDHHRPQPGHNPPKRSV